MFIWEKTASKFLLNIITIVPVYRIWRCVCVCILKAPYGRCFSFKSIYIYIFIMNDYLFYDSVIWFFYSIRSFLNTNKNRKHLKHKYIYIKFTLLLLSFSIKCINTFICILTSQWILHVSFSPFFLSFYRFKERLYNINEHEHEFHIINKQKCIILETRDQF